ncbi:hypothetical protein HY468_04215 [Candidatus Roizmanbacteria bacterium]|nr:hypothetical protein [Candidatus Roizmanbacteria bacterium]
MNQTFKSLIRVGVGSLFLLYNIFFVGAVGLQASRAVTFLTTSPDKQEAVQWLKDLFTNLPVLLVILIVLTLLSPLISLGLATFTNIRKSPWKLFTLLFGIQIPLLALTILRAGAILITDFQFLSKASSPGFSFLFFSALVVAIGTLVYMIVQKKKNNVTNAIFYCIQLAAVLLTSYALIISFFLLPIMLSQLANGYMLSFSLQDMEYAFRGGYLEGFAMLLTQLTLILTWIGFLLTPFAAFYIYVRNAHHLKHDLGQQISKRSLTFLQYGFIAGFILLTVLLSWQPNNMSLFKSIESFKQATSFEEQQQVVSSMPKLSTVKSRLFNIFMSRYTYLSDENAYLTLYRNLNATPYDYQQDNEPSLFIQRLFNSVALPFIYQGGFREDVTQAASGYQALFDASIQAGEQETMVRLLSQSPFTDSNATILDTANQKVRLLQRDTSVELDPSGLLAKVTIQEAYQNTTTNQQEVYYEFTLPEDAVIVSLQLGTDLVFSPQSMDKLKPVSDTQPTPAEAVIIPETTGTPAGQPDQHEGVSAPKGAAEETYEEQIRRTRDPALLAQTGPRQYKLRVYPIPPESTLINQSGGRVVKYQKVRWSYVTLATKNGIEMPNITQQRNVFANKETDYAYYVNGSQVPSLDQFKDQLAERTVCNATTQLETVYEDTVMTFTPHGILSGTRPYICDTNQISSTNVANKKVVLLIDTSYSTGDTVKKELQSNPLYTSLVENNTVDAYFFNSFVSNSVSFSTFDELFDLVTPVGETDRLRVLTAIPSHYDMVLMITDDNPFDLAGTQAKPSTTRPWIAVIHAGDHLPPYHDQLMSQLIHADAVVTTSVSQALNRYTILQQVKNNQNFFTMNEHGIWYQRPYTEGESTPLTDPYSNVLQHIIARNLLYRQIETQTNDLNSLVFLDSLNAQAQALGIVTPYSSLIALVNDQQEQQLAEAVRRDDRYLSESEYGDGFAASAVPEPHEWLLLITGGVLIVLLYRKQLVRFLPFPS